MGGNRLVFKYPIEINRNAATMDCHMAYDKGGISLIETYFEILVAPPLKVPRVKVKLKQMKSKISDFYPKNDHSTNITSRPKMHNPALIQQRNRHLIFASS